MADQHPPPDSPSLPDAPVDRLVAPIARFLHIEAAGGSVLLVATVAALALANSPRAGDYEALWNTRIGLDVGAFTVAHTLRDWINDGLMTVFFFVIGLEIKREMVQGELRDVRSATLPVVAALGGMVVPAGIYLALQHGQPGERGWGIPMATDIAFVVGAMSLLGPRVPRSLRIMMLSLAIVDDIGAILVIAIGYSSHLAFLPLALAAGGFGAIFALQRAGVRSVPIYWIAGIAIWACVHASGIHATLAGVLLGLVTPARTWVGVGLLSDLVRHARELAGGETPAPRDKRLEALAQVRVAATESISPLERLESGLHPWVSFVVMPLFALANAGVPLKPAEFGSPVALAILAALALGKPAGILAFSWIAVRFRICRLPADVGWGPLLAGGCLGGIGFTMALFVAGLALPQPLLDQSKVGILAASGASAILGLALLVLLTRRPDTEQGATPGTRTSP